MVSLARRRRRNKQPAEANSGYSIQFTEFPFALKSSTCSARGTTRTRYRISRDSRHTTFITANISLQLQNLSQTQVHYALTNTRSRALYMLIDISLVYSQTCHRVPSATSNVHPKQLCQSFCCDTFNGEGECHVCWARKCYHPARSTYIR
jgi:hypothetical protein